MKKNISFKAILFVFIVFSSKMYSQINENTYLPNVYPVAPNAFSFMKYGEIPVSKYTGVPNISIPIYTVKAGIFSLPVSLNYHSNGIRVNEEADWTGLGWNLDAGGSIVQVVNGYDDFGPLRNRDLEIDELINHHDYLSSSILSGCTTFNFGIPSGYDIENGLYEGYTTDFSSRTELIQNTVDLQPDIFKFNFMGYSGQFILDWETEQFKCLSDNNVKIVAANYTNGAGSNVAPYEFAIKYPDGNTFIFIEKDQTEVTGKSGVNTGFSLDNFIGSISSRIYKLDRITTNEGFLIEFEYTESDFIENLPSTSEVKESYKADGASNPGNRFSPKNMISTIYTKQKTAYLSSIKFPLGKVVFNSSADRNDISGAHKLNTIEIQKKISATNYVNFKTFNLNYDYFVGSTAGNNIEWALNPSLFSKTKDELTHRLKLESVEELGKPAYEFAYFLENLPKKTSYASDYWGYYNGQLDNSTFIPNLARFGIDLSDSPFNIPISQNKSSDLKYLKAGVLSKIKYPTGGSTFFDYEQNTFDNYEVPSITEEITEENIYVRDTNKSTDGLDKNIVLYAKNSSHVTGSLYVSVQGNCASVTDSYKNTYIELTKFNKTEQMVADMDYGYSGSYISSFYQNEIVAQQKILQLQYGETFKFNENFSMDISPNYVYIINVVFDNACGPQNSSSEGGTAQADLKFVKNNGDPGSLSYGGGLRIKNIRSHTSDFSPAVLKSYTYNGGKLMTPLIYLHKYSYKYDYHTASNGTYKYSFPTVIKTTLSSNSHYLSSSASGKYIGYDTVSEELLSNESNSDKKRGTIVSAYTNNPDYGIIDPKNLVTSGYSLIMPAQKNPLQNGLELSKKYKDNNNNLLREEKNAYFPRPKQCVFGRMSNFARRIRGQRPSSGLMPLTFYNYHSVAFYPISSNKTLLLNSKNINFYDNDSISTITSYTYDDHDQIKEKTHINSKGEIKKTEFNYPYDKNNSTNNLMTSKGIITPVIETNNYLDDALVFSSKKNYKTIATSISPFGINIFSISNVLTKKGNENVYIEEVSFDDYNFKSYDTNSFKLQQYTEKETKKSVILWGHSNQNPIAKIEDATFTEVAQALNVSENQLESLDESDLTQLNSLRELLPNSMVTTYTYDPLIGVTSITDPRGQTIYYEYDEFNRLKHVKDNEGNILSKNEYNYKN